MKFEKITEFHKKLAKNLGDDLVYSLAYDSGKYLLVVSAHKSTKQRFKTADKPMQSCSIEVNDLEKNVDQLVGEITRMYSGILEKI